MGLEWVEAGNAAHTLQRTGRLGPATENHPAQMPAVLLREQSGRGRDLPQLSGGTWTELAARARGGWTASKHITSVESRTC